MMHSEERAPAAVRFSSGSSETTREVSPTLPLSSAVGTSNSAATEPSVRQTSSGLGPSSLAARTVEYHSSDTRDGGATTTSVQRPSAPNRNDKPPLHNLGKLREEPKPSPVGTSAPISSSEAAVAKLRAIASTTRSSKSPLLPVTQLHVDSNKYSHRRTAANKLKRNTQILVLVGKGFLLIVAITFITSCRSLIHDLAVAYRASPYLES